MQFFLDIISLPFQTIELLCTALVVHLQVSFFRKNLVQNPYGRTISKKEKSTFKTVLLMQLGFTITLSM